MKYPEAWAYPIDPYGDYREYIGDIGIMENTMETTTSGLGFGEVIG